MTVEGTTTPPVSLGYDAIRKYAEKVGRHHRIYDPTGRADIDGLVERLGGSSTVADGRESMRVAEEGDFQIFLPSFTSNRRDRFTKAHELGHYFLHYLYPKLNGSESFSRGGRSLAETQANVFASSLLMPEAEYTAAFTSYDGDIHSVARHFDVSPAAAEVRAQVIGLL